MGLRQSDRLRATKTHLTTVFSYCLMRLWIVAVLSFATLLSRAQTPDQIITQLREVNNKVTSAPCNSGEGMLISNKAMNIFLSNKISSYLSDGTDLSLYKNYVNLNASEGRISISHNFHQPVDSDDYVRGFIVIGARVNVANTYAARFSNKYFNNQLGFTLQKTWMGKPVTRYNSCGTQKQAMDAKRAILLHSLETELKRKAADYELALDAVNQTEIPGQDIATAKNTLWRDFYTTLRAEYFRKFSEAQSDLLVETDNYNLITDNWTIFSVYLPVIPQKFQVSTQPNTTIVQRHNYPAEVLLSHTRFFESPKVGRVFFTLSGKGFMNNAVQSGALYQADVSGPTTINNETDVIAVNKGDRFIGSYRNFFTPVVAGKLVYIPGNSHVGVSFRMEKNFGSYHALNSIIGVPIVLIDRRGVPAINFECQLLLSDMGNSTITNQLPGSKTSVGLTVGIPFSKIVY